ncbi:integrase core domain-containing protein [Corynebacterium pseudodiphtheriticum]
MSRRSSHRECPGHNGFVESFHNRLRDKLLEDETFDDPAHVLRCL